MISKRNLLNRIENLESQALEPEVPVTDGNRFQAQTQFNEIWRSNFENLDNKNPFIPYNLWFEILQVSNYFGSLVNIKTESIALNRMWEKIHQLAFIFGLVGVEVVGDKIRAWGITEYEINDFGEYYNLRGITWNKYLTLMNSKGDNSVEQFKANGVKIDESKVFILSNNQNNLNVWLTWVPFLKARDNLLNRLDDIVLSNMKSYVISGTADNPEEVNKMLQAIRSPRTAIFNFAFKEANGKLNINKLNVDTLDAKLGDMSEYLALIDWYNNYWYAILGKRTNNSFKRERNVEAEVDASTANYDVLEAWIFNQSTALLKWLEEQNSEFKADITNYGFQDEANDNDGNNLAGSGDPLNQQKGM